MSLFGDMFKPANCFGGAVLVFCVAAAYYRSVVAGLAFAAIPVFCGIAGGRR
jgi:hypothetical protein